MAILGVLEDVAEGSVVTVYVTNKALAECYSAKWTTSAGKPMVDAEAAEDIFRLRTEKGLTIFVEHRPKDAVYDRLQAFTRDAAGERYRGLAASGLTPAMPKTPLRAKKSGRLRFPPAEGGAGV